MKVHVLDPAAAAVPLVSPVPIVEPAMVRKGWRQLESTVESIIFYGLLGLGFSLPLLGAVYAFIFR